MKSTLTTHLRSILSACCLFLILPFLQAQPWADCDTIRIYSIYVDVFENADHQENFLQAVDRVRVRSGIPMKVLGFSTIIDETTYSFLTNEQNFLNYLNPGFDDSQPPMLSTEIDIAVNDFEPDILLLKVGPVPSSNGMVASLADIHPRRAWYSDFGNNPSNEIILVGASIARLTGFTGYDDSEPNIFSTPGSLPPNIPAPTNFTDSTIQVMVDNYQTLTLGPNELRDCSDLTAINQLSALAAEVITYPDRIAIIDLEKMAQYQLVNQLGQLLQEGELPVGTHEIPFYEFPSGLYYFKINAGKEIFTLPIWLRN